MDTIINIFDKNIVAKTIAISFGTALGVFVIFSYSAHLMGY